MKTGGQNSMRANIPVLCELGEEPSEDSINGELLLDAAKRIGEYMDQFRL